MSGRSTEAHKFKPKNNDDSYFDISFDGGNVVSEIRSATISAHVSSYKEAAPAQRRWESTNKRCGDDPLNAQSLSYNDNELHKQYGTEQFISVQQTEKNTEKERNIKRGREDPSIYFGGEPGNGGEVFGEIVDLLSNGSECSSRSNSCPGAEKSERRNINQNDIDERDIYNGSAHPLISNHIPTYRQVTGNEQGHFISNSSDHNNSIQDRKVMNNHPLNSFDHTHELPSYGCDNSTKNKQNNLVQAKLVLHPGTTGADSGIERQVASVGLSKPDYFDCNQDIKNSIFTHIDNSHQRKIDSEGNGRNTKFNTECSGSSFNPYSALLNQRGCTRSNNSNESNPLPHPRTMRYAASGSHIASEDVSSARNFPQHRRGNPVSRSINFIGRGGFRVPFARQDYGDIAQSTVSSGFESAATVYDRDAPNRKFRPMSLQSAPPPYQVNRQSSNVNTQQHSHGVSVARVVDSLTNNKLSSNKPPDSNRSTDSCDEAQESEYPPELLNQDGSVPQRLKNLDGKLVTAIWGEVVSTCAKRIEWEDIAGLPHAKEAVQEAVIWPILHPELFCGSLRQPPKGLLLFGPPGTGKTMIPRAIATDAGCTFFSISASSLMSKWIGEGEKMVRCLFTVAQLKSPSVIFIDEIDSLLSLRTEGEMDAVRRVKTEFLVQLDGMGTGERDRVLVIGATNRPDDLDEAARRRLEKKLYIPLPDGTARTQLLDQLMKKSELKTTVTSNDLEEISRLTPGFSGADMHNLAREAAMAPVREQMKQMRSLTAADLRPVTIEDFHKGLKQVRPSVGQDEIKRFEDWNKQFGSADLMAPRED